MQQTIFLQAELRDKSQQKPNALRRQGMIPAVLYGKNVGSQNLVVRAKEFEKAYKQAGASTLVDLKIGNQEPVRVLIQEVAPHHITLKPIHADFYQVSMTEKLTATIPLKFTSEAPAVKEFSGVLLKIVQEVEVECLPSDLVSDIEVDLSPLKTFEDSIKIKDILVPPGIVILNKKPEDSVAMVQQPREEEVAAVAPSEKEQIEAIEKGGERKEPEEKEGAEEKKEEGKKDEKEKK